MERRDEGTQRKILVGCCCVSLALSWASAQAGETRRSVSAETGLSTWETEHEDVHFRLTQISQEQARAFMLARGLDEKSTGEFANTCVFMSVLRNEGRKPIKYSLAEWRHVPMDGSPRLMLTKHDWLASWQQREFSKPVRIAFEWSQLPVEQTFAPGDWNQGMTTYDLPAGSQFDVVYRWWQNGKFHEGVLENVQCPPRAD